MLPKEINEEMLMNLFSTLGDLKEVNITMPLIS
jgi:hypothetical protein